MKILKIFLRCFLILSIKVFTKGNVRQYTARNMLSFDCQDISLCLVRIIVQTLYLEVSLLFDVNNFILKPTFVGFEDSHLR